VVSFVVLPVPAMRAMIDGDLMRASAAAGHQLSPWLMTESWLWQLRVEDIERDPAAAEWVARAAVSDGQVVGHAGFHGPPDADGRVEVGYTTDPAFRRRGLARQMLSALIDRAKADPRVRIVRASISPENAASLATVAPFGFERVGEQWDEEDGLEVLYELRV
jgi:RimJ/RimL family protein N-acetyltransferase